MAFEGCKTLTDIKIPDNVKYIGKDAFKDCDSLRYVRLPKSLKHLGDCFSDRLEKIDASAIEDLRMSAQLAFKYGYQKVIFNSRFQGMIFEERQAYDSEDLLNLRNRDISVIKQVVEKTWPDTMYRGRKIFDWYMGKVSEYNDYSQECYLGYLPNSDKFIVGFDLNGNRSASRTFKVDRHAQVSDIVDKNHNKLFYDGAYGIIKRTHKNLVDLRLD